MITNIERIRKEIKSRKMEQAELAEKIDFGKGTISRILTGKIEPRIDTLVQISQVLEIPLFELVNLEVGKTEFDLIQQQLKAIRNNLSPSEQLTLIRIIANNN